MGGDGRVSHIFEDAPALGAYTVLHGRRSLQLSTQRLLVPAHEMSSFVSAVECAQALSSLFEHERTRVEAALAQAREEGWAQGRDQGRQAAEQAVAEAVGRMAKHLQAQQAAAREAVGTLALAVVAKLSASLGATRVVPALVEQAVIELLPARSTRVRVAPSVLDATRAHLAELGLEADVRADDHLGEFDGVVESVHGQSWVGLDTQLAAMGRALGAQASVGGALE
jgi:type III secretion protein L